ncbi:uncharacterized protein B0I36DRAFT_317849 [Microdochium trichocladiopsis]|uniref:Glycoprotease family protein n=1 Tax=Microdochium trichocladiopsis TaxID=1682393 RepID=A0A9P9BQS8_9PEZI|nr:uncharacterized protein B0I36DRAFT_317849 [Microdochium trichocladiopsis]KAH7035203.1 hypothetical protein B0I36DRAFT_317849 [Microdochium trichocladiopsis]
MATIANSHQKDEWEDWEDEDDCKVTTSTSPDAHHSTITPIPNSEDTTTLRGPQSRYSVQRPSRIKSKGRQKAQNAKAGIKLVTDMSKFRRPAASGPKSALASAREDKRGKFVDTAALLALEGEPTSASIGSFSWLKKKQGYSRFNKSVKKHGRGPSADLSPAERPIVIGIAVPENNAASHQVSPWTAVLETPANMFGASHIPGQQSQAHSNSSPQQLRSVWSPDTEASISPQQGLQTFPPIAAAQGPGTAPPLPATSRLKQTGDAAVTEDDDLDTPCTLFEEDGSPLATRKSLRPPVTAMTPDSAASRSHGWWDHVTTPFSAKTPHDLTSTTSPSTEQWWKHSNEKNAETSGSSAIPARIVEVQQSEKIAPISTSHLTQRNAESTAEKAPTSSASNTAAFAPELPPPYSPPKEQVKYGVVLPPAQLFPQQARVASPRPSTPGLPGTMTSQGSVGLSDVPLTPAALGHTALPDRAPGSLPGDHFLEARGRANKTERQRRRHEKEDVVARKVGGFWRGRGCMPENGCMGRTGREGRQRRRICLGVIGGLLALVILAIVLAVVLTRKAIVTHTEEPVSVFLNLTNFPPMPTGVLTMSGPDNTVAFSDCMHQGTPKTSWSCSLPKEEHASVAPFAANQPEFIFQVQFDNHTQASWSVPDGADPVTMGFSPSPAPPKFKDMDFLGNTTDRIVSEKKAGEATPFYISLLHSVNETVGPNVLARRQGFNNQIGSGGDNGTADFDIADQLPRPGLKADGTIAPAHLFPRPVQQPIRLFDRGLPTEHYGFYTYFNKTIFMNDKVRASPLDRDGGAPREDANYLVVFGQARFLVQIWTRKENTTQLLGNGTTPGTEGASIFSKPGTMPYPVTVTEDMHGGDPTQKIDYYWGLTEDKHVNTTDAKLIIADRGFGGGLVNPMAQRDPSIGGIDGGTGGCRCEWVNFKK